MNVSENKINCYFFLQIHTTKIQTYLYSFIFILHFLQQTLRTRVERPIEAALSIHVLTILPLLLDINGKRIGSTVRGFVLGRVKAAKSHHLHHFDLFLGLALKGSRIQNQLLVIVWHCSRAQLRLHIAQGQIVRRWRALIAIFCFVRGTNGWGAIRSFWITSRWSRSCPRPTTGFGMSAATAVFVTASMRFAASITTVRSWSGSSWHAVALNQYFYFQTGRKYIYIFIFFQKMGSVKNMLIEIFCF